MSLPVFTFYIFAAVIVGSAIMVIAARNAITSALFLALSLVTVAGLYLTLHAEFMFAVQILVYTGGVMVLFLFVIMLVNVDELEHVRRTVRSWWLPTGFVAATFAGLIAFGSRGRLSGGMGSDGPAGLMSNTRAVSLRLFSDYLLPFEVVSIILLVAMLGAIMLAKKEI